MDSLNWCLDLGQSFAKSIPIAGPRYLALAMPALQDAAFIASLAWILYRIWQIYQKPVDELVNLLGLDIPPVPEISLAGITAEGVLLFWKPPENTNPSLIHAIHVNGIKVGEFGKGDTSIQVTGLKPGQFYSIRVIASNAANFSTLGPLIRLRTLSPSKQANGALTASTEDSPVTTGPDEAASIRISTAPFEPAAAQPIPRENSGCHAQPKRASSGRRNSPPIPVEQSLVQTSVHESEELALDDIDIDRLTGTLDTLRHEQQALERQILEDEDDSRNSLTDLAKERDHLKQTLKEREEASNELRKQGNLLSKQQKTAQSRKAQKERMLNAKNAERQKTKEEISRWNEEIMSMHQEIDDISSEQADVETDKDREVSEVRAAIAADQAVVKTLEDDIRATGSQIKAMEKEREMMSDGGDEESALVAQEKQDDQAWEAHAHNVQLHLGTLWQALKQANLDSQRAKEELAWWTNLHTRDPTQFAAMPALDYTSAMRSHPSRRNRHSSSRASTISSPPGSYTVGPGPFNSNPTMSPSYSSISPFFNMGNGMAVPPLTDQAGLSPADAEALAGEAPMSPTADDLLPSNLFRDEDTMSRRTNAAAARGSLGSLGSDVFGKQADSTGQAPHTPVSAGSCSGSRFSSPHDSLRNPPGYTTNGEYSLEADRRSINSTGASFQSPVPADANTIGSNKFASLISSTFNRQRGRSGNSDPPQLGTLRQGQSQAFPRQYGDDEFDPSGTRRRRGSHSHWANPMGLLNRNSPEDGNLIRTRTGSGRRSRLNMFGYNSNPLQPSALSDHPSSARPSSINSFDQMLGRPSSESQRNPWAMPESTQSRSSPLGANWVNNTSSGPWSRGPSRRPSIQHGSTSNLSLGSTPLELDYSNGLSKQPSEQLPIGTRPRASSGLSSQRPVTPKLNPAAPSFKMLFGRSDAKRAAKADKAAEKTKDKAADSEDIDSLHEESSPQNPRHSRDAQSIVTSASISESHDSLDRSTSGTPSEAVTPSGPKESLMQRISRKGSSSKFNVPWGKERGGLFSRKGGDSTPSGDMDEDADSEKHEEQVVHHPPTEKTSRTSLSWPNIRRKSKKGGLQLGEAERGHEDGDGEE